jgi:hypothetical protein
MDKMITITEKEYKRLQDAEAKLDALENFGVDNWGGYGLAMRWLRNGCKEEDLY